MAFQETTERASIKALGRLGAEADRENTTRASNRVEQVPITDTRQRTDSEASRSRGVSSEVPVDVPPVMAPTASPTSTQQEKAGMPTTEATVHRSEVVGVSDLHEDSNRGLGGGQDGERSCLSSADQMGGIICAYPWDCAYWTAVARCESTLSQDPYAYDDRNPNIGLFQIWEGHKQYEREWLYDDANNTQAAWELSYGGMYTGAWPNCP